MAIIPRNNIKNCGKPENVEGPYLASCVYEFIMFVDCSAGGTTADLRRFMDRNAKGTVLSYTLGAPMILGSRSLSFTDILGTPVSRPISMGLITSQWDDYFLGIPPWVGGGGPELVNTPKWHLAQSHNNLFKKHRWPMMKYIYREDTFITKEELDQGWRCPSSPMAADGTYLPGMSSQDMVNIGIQCPGYYKLSSCVDCNGASDGDVEDVYFEMKDRTRLPAGKIIEYPIGSKNCLSPSLLTAGPKNDTNYNTITNELVTTSINGLGTVFKEHDDCVACRENYILAVAKVDAVDTELFADPDFINSILGVENAILNAVVSHKIQFGFMLKGDPLNDAFYNAHGGAAFYYKAANGQCYKARFFDRATAAGNGIPCIPAQFGYWARYWVSASGIFLLNSTAYWFHASSFATATYYDDECKCAASGGNIGTSDTYDKCYPPDGPPTIISQPENVSIKVSSKAPSGNASFSITVTPPAVSTTPIEYQWYYNGVAIPGARANTLTKLVKIEHNHDPANNEPSEVYCIVSNNNGKTTIRSSTAFIFVTKTPFILWPGRTVFLATAEIYCLDRAELGSLKSTTPIIGTTNLATPEKTGSDLTRRVYLNPDDFDVYDSNLRASDIEGKYWIRKGSGGLCTGSSWRVYKIISGSVTEEKWETDVPMSLKGTRPGSLDERVDNDIMLTKDMTYSLPAPYVNQINLDFLSANDWKAQKNSLMKAFGIFN